MFTKNIDKLASSYRSLIAPARRRFSSGMTPQASNTPAYILGGVGVAGFAYAALQAGMMRRN